MDQIENVKKPEAASETRLSSPVILEAAGKAVPSTATSGAAGARKLLSVPLQPGESILAHPDFRVFPMGQNSEPYDCLQMQNILLAQALDLILQHPDFHHEAGHEGNRQAAKATAAKKKATNRKSRKDTTAADEIVLAGGAPETSSNASVTSRNGNAPKKARRRRRHRKAKASKQAESKPNT